RPVMEGRILSRLWAGEGEMSDAAGGAYRLDAEALLDPLEPVPHPLPAPEDDGHDGDVQVVDQVGVQELTDSGRPPADANVQAARGLPGDFQGLGRARVDEVKRRAALHLNRGPGVMSKHEHRSAEDRFIAPPALPFLVSPRAALRPELVAPHD